MLGWLVRGLLLVAGFIASFFVPRDALNFSIIQMVIAILLFTFAVILVALWPMLKDWFVRRMKKRKKHE
ncbi:MAG: hypothetical protein ABI370_10260 [Gammaproteobacteria bacterium]